MNRRTAATALLGPLFLVALSGCGIQETDVVEAGGAATVIVAPIPNDRIVLYFLGPDGRSMPVARDPQHPGPEATFPTDGSTADTATYEGFGPGYEISADDLKRSGAAVTTDKILAMLLAGPQRHEASAGITTDLPALHGEGPHVVPVDATTSARRTLRLRAPFPVRELSDAAVRQLVCTTAYADHPTGLADVSVTGPDGTLPTSRCDD
ncbi:hypothetical protein [Streptomyces sp. NPDC058326]|uniref:hypothetical protein n=1 Tax=Streptomyces sp. NPDC058326 TaxID=3346447 RepID=UPI0036E43CD0